MRAESKKETIKKFAAANGLTVKEAAAKYDAVMEFVLTEVINGSAIRIPGLGTLHTVLKPAKECRVPGSDRMVAVPERITVKLKGKTYPVTVTAK